MTIYGGYKCEWWREEEKKTTQHQRKGATCYETETKLAQGHAEMKRRGRERESESVVRKRKARSVCRAGGIKKKKWKKTNHKTEGWIKKKKVGVCAKDSQKIWVSGFRLLT